MTTIDDQVERLIRQARQAVADLLAGGLAQRSAAATADRLDEVGLQAMNLSTAVRVMAKSDDDGPALLESFGSSCRELARATRHAAARGAPKAAPQVKSRTGASPSRPTASAVLVAPGPGPSAAEIAERDRLTNLRLNAAREEARRQRRR
jgi:hypothetical protein